MPELEPAGPLLTSALFEPLGDELLALLRGLARDDWTRRTVCADWTVQDLAAHLLDTALRRLSIERDGHTPPPPDRAIGSYRDLVEFLNDLNKAWVIAWRRMSPETLIDAMATAERGLAEHLPRIDPFAQARFSVAWAGEEESLNWFDQARELTERWHHQQQIRLAVGAPTLDEPRYSRPVLETFLHALPHRYQTMAAPRGTTVSLRIDGREAYEFTLRRDDRWVLLRGVAATAEAGVVMTEQDAWLLLTKGLAGTDARHRAQVGGDQALLRPIFETLAVMA
ncbi:MAG: maleylpyruvate isomerase N-terminal domain-containing protein [Acidobacteriota bacterium]